jgi:uncharacterized membrane-anchored protein YhcB (DUF1043 family)
MSPADTPLETRKPRRFRNFLIALILVAAAFAAGLLLGELRLRQASAAWKADQQKLEAAVADATKSLDALKAAQALWEIDGQVSEVLADLADNNFGLARDAADAARLLLEKAAPGFTVAQSSALAPLEGVLKDLGQSATSLSPDVKSKAREARSLLRAALKEAP